MIQNSISFTDLQQLTNSLRSQSLAHFGPKDLLILILALIYRQPSLFAGVTFLENTVNTKFNNDLKAGVPFPIFILKCEKIYTKAKLCIDMFDDFVLSFKKYFSFNYILITMFILN
jgi:hypothetical protein